MPPRAGHSLRLWIIAGLTVAGLGLFLASRLVTPGRGADSGPHAAKTP